ncbi:unnamed protein product [Linum tenue]|uniref:Uncharacterized protein n=1 Tax=Linum tenue TaxID=586396 RepID=A0AAV0R3A7_9ROSI|nr:unnamed protein product [Linum tenue]
MDSANVIPSAKPQIYRSSVPWKRRAVFIHPEDQYQRCVLSAEEEEAFEREEAALQFQLSQLRRMLSHVARKRRHHILKQKVHRRGLPFEHQGCCLLYFVASLTY